MADNRSDYNSSDHSTHTWDQQQRAITDAANAQRVAEARAAEAAVQAAKRKAPVKNMTPGLDAGDFGGNNFNVIPAVPTPKPRAMRKGK